MGVPNFWNDEGFILFYHFTPTLFSVIFSQDAAHDAQQESRDVLSAHRCLTVATGTGTNRPSGRKEATRLTAQKDSIAAAQSWSRTDMHV